MTRAWEDYAHAAQAAGVKVRTLEPHELAHAQALWEQIWGGTVVENHMLTALAHSGNYVAGAFDGDTLVGAATAFFSRPLGRAMHSHVAGVSALAAGKGVGTAIKLHQRAWGLDLGVTEMTWTFDPLVARNAQFNLSRLGASCEQYVVNHYGPMTDGVNAGDETDRIVARWRLERDLPSEPGAVPVDAAVAVAIDDNGAPQISTVSDHRAAITVALPADIEALRRSDPAKALEWRRAVREALAPRLAEHWSITAVSREAGYVVERAP